jgi:hypothetical protein
LGDNIENNEMGGACSAYGEDRDVYRILVGKPDGDHWGDAGLNWTIILKWIFRKLDVGFGLDWAGSG